MAFVKSPSPEIIRLMEALGLNVNGLVNAEITISIKLEDIVRVSIKEERLCTVDGVIGTEAFFSEYTLIKKEA